MEESLRYFGSRVDKLIRGVDLCREEANFLFRQILKNAPASKIVAPSAYCCRIGSGQTGSSPGEHR
ncbi:MAG: hypothetical protein LUP00_03825, partial [Methanothrix sp.]|nr:hypothetical protein [Methanothrix sp.]